MKNLAQYKYRILRLDSDDAANMLYVNGRLIHRSRDEIGEKSYSVCIHIYILLPINNLLKYLKYRENHTSHNVYFTLFTCFDFNHQYIQCTCFRTLVTGKMDA